MFRRHRENKAKLEYKLCLARDSPDSTFDVSECDLKNVPQGIYSLCKVFLKDILQMDHNCLSSLSGGGSLRDLSNLKVLDISHNQFSVIPDDIDLLVNLKKLYLNNNNLKKIPPRICNLVVLETLDVSDNMLQSLPEDMGKMNGLQSVNLLGNKHLTCLPKSICHIPSLSIIKVNCDNFVYPPTSIVQQGTDAILKYICDDTGHKYNAQAVNENLPAMESNEFDEDTRFQVRIRELNKVKEQKAKEFLDIQRQNDLLKQQELELATTTKLNKEKLLADLTLQQNKFDFKLSRLHQQKEMERFHLVEQLQEAEQHADAAIMQLLSINTAPSAQLLEMEKDYEKMLLAIDEKRECETVSRMQILNDMQEVLQQEGEIRIKHYNNRLETTKEILEKELQSDSHIMDILSSQGLQKTELLSQIQENNELQKAAVAALIERGDSRSWCLIQQIHLVESKLASLTALEIERQKLEMENRVHDLSEKRQNLSLLLMELLEQQNERRLQLLSTVQQLDQSKSGEDFWLRQYQNLIERLPNSVSKSQNNIDFSLTEILLAKGVIHYLPLLAKLLQTTVSITDITETHLTEAGITRSVDRTTILECFTIHDNRTSNKYPEASAPIPEASTPTAPPAETDWPECIICMDFKCQVIFMPCGHLCCCGRCSVSLMTCPLCRGELQQKVKIIAP